MATFVELQARVQRYLLDLPTDTLTEIPGWINAGIRKAEEMRSFLHMAEQSRLDVITRPGTPALGDKPDNWKESRADPWMEAFDGRTIPLKWLLSTKDLIATYDSPVVSPTSTDTGPPAHIRETSGVFQVYPLPDNLSDWPAGGNYADGAMEAITAGQYRISLPYFGYSAALANPGDTNFWTLKAEDYVVFYAVGEGHAFNFDEARYQFWGLTYDRNGKPVGKAAHEFERLKKLDAAIQTPKSMTLRVRKDVYAPRSRSRRP